ncbi:MAG: pro-sigmaK processing inhibitor BofA family protein [Candidatus Micrarchaeota archaeon]
MTTYVELGALIVALFLLYLLMRFLKNPSHILANSILGIIAFLILDLFGFGIPINIISVGIVAIGGLTGLLLIIILHILGIGF